MGIEGVISQQFFWCLWASHGSWSIMIWLGFRFDYLILDVLIVYWKIQDLLGDSKIRRHVSIAIIPVCPVLPKAQAPLAIYSPLGNTSQWCKQYLLRKQICLGRSPSMRLASGNMAPTEMIDCWVVGIYFFGLEMVYFPFILCVLPEHYKPKSQ